MFIGHLVGNILRKLEADIALKGNRLKGEYFICNRTRNRYLC